MFNRNTLRFLCISSVMFFYHSYAGGIITFDTEVPSDSGIYIERDQYPTTNTIVQEQLQTLKPASSIAQKELTRKLCSSSGYYVASCNNYRVGFNWLRSAKVPDLEQSNQNLIVYHTTNDYYSDDDDILTLFKKMRIFFGHYQEPAVISASDEDIKKDREAILNNICNPNNDNIKIYCEKCPNDNSKVPPSTVDLDGNNSIISGSWNFYTIADCYMDKFEDSTGTYFYVPDNIPNLENADLEHSEKCYYTNTNPNALDALNGDKIGDIALGINTQESIAKPERAYVLPSSGINQ